MPWYKTGTVSVVLNSNAVIGTGTAFIANCRVGDGFRGPDGAWYEVTNIASDTAMSISPNYQGASNGAGGYALAPLQGYVKDSADQLRSVINQFGTSLAVLGGSGTIAGTRASLNLTNTDGVPEGVFNKYWTAARTLTTLLTGVVFNNPVALVATDTALQAFGKLQALWNTLGTAAFGTLTSGTADTTVGRVLKVGDFGVGVITAASAVDANAIKYCSLVQCAGSVNTPTAYGLLRTDAANSAGYVRQTFFDFVTTSGKGYERYQINNIWSPWYLLFGQNTIVGAVSQSAGNVTGAVIEKGVNANGSYTKFADGTLICFGEFQIAVQTITTQSIIVCTHPATFVGGYEFFASPIASIGSGSQQGCGSVLLNGMFLTKNGPSTAVNIYTYREAIQVNTLMGYMAIGRWF